MKSFIDEDSYLNQEKIRTWMEGILSKVADTTRGHITYIKLHANRNKYVRNTLI